MGMLDDLRARGEPMEASVYWDLDDIRLKQIWGASKYSQRDILMRVLRFVAGVLDAPVTRAEAIEVTQAAWTDDNEYKAGRATWHEILRHCGGVVHRVWPPMDDQVPRRILQRMRSALDDMQQGGKKRILCVLSSEKGFEPMFAAAQREGATLFRFSQRKFARYYPGGANFSVPFVVPHWFATMKELLDLRWDPFRSAEQRFEWQGPIKWSLDGIVHLDNVQEEEQDYRVFHRWVKRGSKQDQPSKVSGQFVRKGRLLNASLVHVLQDALKRTGRRALRAHEAEALGAHLPQLRLPSAVRGLLPMPTAEEGSSAGAKADTASASAAGQEEAAGQRSGALVLWDMEEMNLRNNGLYGQRELAARVVRWLEGFLGEPVRRVEVSRFMEPWETMGADPSGGDWLAVAKSIGAVPHRVWPPDEDATLNVLEPKILEYATKVKAIALLSEEPLLHTKIRAAQKAGTSVFWMGRWKKGLYFPAGTNVTIPVDIVGWLRCAFELSEADCHPHVPGAPHPGAPVMPWQSRAVPTDLTWGKVEMLALDTSENFDGTNITSPTDPDAELRKLGVQQYNTKIKTELTDFVGPGESSSLNDWN